MFEACQTKTDQLPALMKALEEFATKYSIIDPNVYKNERDSMGPPLPTLIKRETKKTEKGEEKTPWIDITEEGVNQTVKVRWNEWTERAIKRGLFEKK